VTKPESAGADTADPQTQTTATRIDAPPKRPWWKRPAGAAAATIVLAVITVGGYSGVNALLPHPSRQRTPQSTPRATEHVPKYLPPGADWCPQIYPDVPGRFDASARGTPATSCQFAEEVRKEYWAQSPPSSGPAGLKVLSPATRNWYDLACLSSGDYVTCTGGAAAVIYLYHSSGSNRQG
jgi:hypothetical protein